MLNAAYGYNTPMPATPVAAESTLLPLLYAVDHEHGWNQGMRAITHELLAAYPSTHGLVLELGCGSGLFLQELRDRRPQQLCIGIDRSAIALGYADQQAGVQVLAQADLRQLPFPADHFELLVALDVFDQRRVNLQQAVCESWRILQPNGMLLLRVSAHPWLHSPHDRAFNTGRRYQRQEVLTVLTNAAFKLERVTYANTFLAIPVILQRILQRWRLLAFSHDHSMSPAVNQMVAHLLHWEAELLRARNLPFGISLYVVARKRP